MRTGTGWSLCWTGSAAIFRGGADGRRQWAFVNLADRGPLFQQLRSRLKSRAPVSCTGSSWATGIRASTPKEADRGWAISGPLTPVTRGLSRSLTDSPLRRSGNITGPDGTASQADSAGSIPVTRSKAKPQVKRLSRSSALGPREGNDRGFGSHYSGRGHTRGMGRSPKAPHSS
jgi:hypothetical protein